MGMLKKLAAIDTGYFFEKLDKLGTLFNYKQEKEPNVVGIFKIH